MLKRYFYYLFLLILLFFVPISLVSRLRDTAAQALKPAGIFLVRQNIDLGNFFNSFRQISQLRDQKQRLQQQVYSLQQELAGKKDLEMENTTLRQELGVTGTTYPISKVLAQIIIQGSNPTDKTYLVDVGVPQGVKEGQPAIYQGFLIGRVVSVREHSTVIRAITSRESRVQVRLADSQEKGLLIGDGNAAYITDLTQGVTIRENSPVETSGLGGSLPQGILIGTIGSRLSKESDLSQSYLINLSQDPAGVSSFFILLTENP